MARGPFADRTDPALLELDPLGGMPGHGVLDPTKLEEALIHYFDHPTDWVIDIIGARPDAWQGEMMDGVHQDRFVAVRSGNGVGKSCGISWLVLWFLCTRPFSRVIVTANTKEQLLDVIWAEAKEWIDKSQMLSQVLVWQKDRIAMKSNPENWFAVARTAEVRKLGKTGLTVAEGLQGRHAKQGTLVIVDEASGVDEAVFAALEGALADENVHMVITGNPTRPSGYFYEAFHTRRHMWHCIHVNAEECERTKGSLLVKRALEYCNGNRDDPYYLIKVRGEFPPEGHNSVFSLIDIEACAPPNLSDLKPTDYDPYELGVDVAAFGDAKTAITVKHGPVVERIDEYSKADTMETCGRVIQYIRKYRPVSVRIDIVGLGRGVFDRLRELGFKECLGVTNSAKPVTPQGEKQYMNVRAEGYWNLRQLIERRQIRLPNDPALTSQMTSITYKYTSSGKVQIESKDDLHSRNVKSPDKLDSLVLACQPISVVRPAGTRVRFVPFMAR